MKFKKIVSLSLSLSMALNSAALVYANESSAINNEVIESASEQEENIETEGAVEEDLLNGDVVEQEEEITKDIIEEDNQNTDVILEEKAEDLEEVFEENNVTSNVEVKNLGLSTRAASNFGSSTGSVTITNSTNAGTFSNMEQIVCAIQNLDDGASVEFSDGSFDFTITNDKGKKSSGFIISANNVTVTGSRSTNIIANSTSGSSSIQSSKITCNVHSGYTFNWYGTSTIYVTGSDVTLDGLNITSMQCDNPDLFDPKTVETRVPTGGFTMENCTINGGLVYLALLESPSALSTINNNIFNQAILQPKSSMTATGNTFDGYQENRNVMVWISAYTVGTPWQGFDVTMNENKFLGTVLDGLDKSQGYTAIAIFNSKKPDDKFDSSLEYNIDISDNYFDGFGYNTNVTEDAHVNDFINYALYDETYSELLEFIGPNNLEHLKSGEFEMLGNPGQGKANVIFNNIFLDEAMTLRSDTYVEVASNEDIELTVGETLTLTEEEYEALFEKYGIHVDITEAISENDSIFTYDPITRTITAVSVGEAYLQYTDKNGTIYDLVLIKITAEIGLNFTHNGTALNSLDTLETLTVSEIGKVITPADITIPDGYVLADEAWSHTITAADITNKKIDIPLLKQVELTIELVDEDGNVVDTITITTVEGDVITLDMLELPEGYTFADDTWTYTVSADETSTQVSLITKPEENNNSNYIVYPEEKDNSTSYYTGKDKTYSDGGSSSGGGNSSSNSGNNNNNNNVVDIDDNDVPLGPVIDNKGIVVNTLADENVTSSYNLVGDDKTSFVKNNSNYSLIKIPYKVGNVQSNNNIVLLHLENDGSYTLIPTSKYIDGVVYGVTNKQGKFVLANYKKQGSLVDIKAHWSKDLVEFAAARSMTLDNSKNFKPDQNLTRAEFTKLLATLVAEDIEKYNYQVFGDVGADHAYLKYITWAKDLGVVAGVGENNFAPDDYISREQMAVMLNRFINNVFKADLAKTENKNEYSDNNSISEYAKSSVYDMQNFGVMIGRGENAFAPKAYITRGETASILNKYISGLNDTYIGKE